MYRYTDCKFNEQTTKIYIGSKIFGISYCLHSYIICFMKLWHLVSKDCDNSTHQSVSPWTKHRLLCLLALEVHTYSSYKICNCSNIMQEYYTKGKRKVTKELIQTVHSITLLYILNTMLLYQIALEFNCWSSVPLNIHYNKQENST